MKILPRFYFDFFVSFFLIFIWRSFSFSSFHMFSSSLLPCSVHSGSGHDFYLQYQSQPRGCVDMCWTLVAEEPHRSTILHLEHCPLKANVSCLIFPLHQGKMSSAQPLSGLDSPSQESRGQLKTIPSYHSPLLFPPLQQEKQRARIQTQPPLASISRSLVVLQSPPWSALNRPCLRFPVAITVLAVALDMRMPGLSCCFL